LPTAFSATVGKYRLMKTVTTNVSKVWDAQP
jgi:hypothetical protein